jgi:hypothetical protein
VSGTRTRRRASGMDGGRPCGVCGCGIGCRGFVVEVDRYAIARRKPSYSMGPILDARGGSLCCLPGGRSNFFFFYTLGFAGSLGLCFAGEHGVFKVHMMMTNIESSTEAGYNLAVADHQTNVSENFGPRCLSNGFIKRGIGVSASYQPKLARLFCCCFFILFFFSDADMDITCLRKPICLSHDAHPEMLPKLY